MMNPFEIIQSDIREVKDLFLKSHNPSSQIQIEKSRVVSIKDASESSGLKQSKIYELVRDGEISHSKPGGKVIYVNLDEIEAWKMRNRIPSKYEIEQC